jgi:hypothetical protein
MALIQTRSNHEIRDGNVRMIFGTFTNTEGSTGGTIHTKLHRVIGFTMQLLGDAVATDTPVVNGALSDPDVVVVTPADSNGVWCATGV